jgi:hypothetical protein
MSLWEDLQTSIYMLATGAKFIVYETVIHSNVSPEMGETDEEFEVRKSTMKQPGRAKQKMPESPADYMDRLRRSVVVEREIIGRNELVLTQRLEEFRVWSELVTVGPYPQNSGSCFGNFGGRRCQFYDLCVSGEHPHVLATMYEARPVHQDRPDFAYHGMQSPCIMSGVEENEEGVE